MHEDFLYDNATWSKEDPKQIIIQRVPADSAVLDIGCGNGLLGEWLKQNKGCTVTGIEGHPQGFKEAKSRLDRVYQIDLNDAAAIKQALTDSRFDVITGVDVLEHCYHPLEILAVLKAQLRAGGRVIFSIPNVAHHSVRFGLLRGRWEYQDTGILDRTHVAFYTKTTAAELIEKVGFKVTSVEHTRPTKGIWRLIDGFDPTLSAVQFIVIATA